MAGHWSPLKQLFREFEFMKITQKRQPLFTVGGNVNWCSHCGRQYEGVSKI